MPLNYPIDQIPTIRGGGLLGTHIFQQLHFHWGSDDSHGSEHQVNSIPYAAELHLVHYNSKYGTYENALAYADGLTVLGVFLQPSVENNTAFDPIIKHLTDVVHEGNQVVIPEPVNFHDILPIKTSSFYRYAGSLTTPNCDEIVIWTVFATSNFLNQLMQFCELTNDVGDPLVNNDRPVQPFNKRVVYST